MRGFIAIQLPKEIKDILAGIQDDLKQAQADVKWVKPQNIHLTLNFLGEIDEDLTKKIQKIIDQIAGKNPCFSLCLNQLGAFPKLLTPRVIWINLTNEKPVLVIARELKMRLREIGLAQESRKFSTHITLGRVRSGLNQEALIKKLELLNSNKAAGQTEFNVRSLTLFKSTITNSGPIYETIYEYLLASD